MPRNPSTPPFSPTLQPASPEQVKRLLASKLLLPADQVNTNTHVLGNRPRPKGVVEKCTFCDELVDKGRGHGDRPGPAHESPGIAARDPR